MWSSIQWRWRMVMLPSVQLSASRKMLLWITEVHYNCSFFKRFELNLHQSTDVYKYIWFESTSGPKFFRRFSSWKKLCLICLQKEQKSHLVALAGEYIYIYTGIHSKWEKSLFHGIYICFWSNKMLIGLKHPFWRRQIKYVYAW